MFILISLIFYFPYFKKISVSFAVIPLVGASINLNDTSLIIVESYNSEKEYHSFYFNNDSNKYEKLFHYHLFGSNYIGALRGKLYALGGRHMFANPLNFDQQMCFRAATAFGVDWLNVASDTSPYSEDTYLRSSEIFQKIHGQNSYCAIGALPQDPQFNYLNFINSKITRIPSLHFFDLIRFKKGFSVICYYGKPCLAKIRMSDSITMVSIPKQYLLVDKFF